MMKRLKTAALVGLMMIMGAVLAPLLSIFIPLLLK